MKRADRLLRAGTYVRLKVTTMFGSTGRGIVTKDMVDSTVDVMLEGGPALVCRHEVSVLRDQTTPWRLMRLYLPYGMWVAPGERQVLFNREYQPIWQRYAGQPATAADPKEIVRYTREEWFYDDTCQPWKDKQTKSYCERILAAWGVPL